jgi:hypothetical protein
MAAYKLWMIASPNLTLFYSRIGGAPDIRRSQFRPFHAPGQKDLRLGQAITFLPRFGCGL